MTRRRATTKERGGMSARGPGQGFFAGWGRGKGGGKGYCVPIRQPGPSPGPARGSVPGRRAQGGGARAGVSDPGGTGKSEGGRGERRLSRLGESRGHVWGRGRAAPSFVAAPRGRARRGTSGRPGARPRGAAPPKPPKPPSQVPGTYVGGVGARWLRRRRTTSQRTTTWFASRSHAATKRPPTPLTARTRAPPPCGDRKGSPPPPAAP